jgi:hypothetical protein
MFGIRAVLRILIRIILLDPDHIYSKAHGSGSGADLKGTRLLLHFQRIVRRDTLKKKILFIYIYILWIEDPF